MAYFITDDNTLKERDPNINIINGILKVKGKTSVNVLVSNYTNKHLTFHKGEYIGHLEPAVMDNNTIEQIETHQTNSITLEKMMAETVTPDTFKPTMPWIIYNCLTWTWIVTMGIWISVCKGWNFNWNHPSYQHDDRYRQLWPHLSKTLPHSYETLSMGKGWNRKLASSKSSPY